MRAWLREAALLARIVLTDPLLWLGLVLVALLFLFCAIAIETIPYR